ncbi:EF-hand domain-containing protein [Devosia sp. 2618]|uniref:EF-hand domain-containing protein n=1 Tax=Devosia sp. 2618 TaxID=3156454 RepID=UPI003394CC0E
MKSKTLLVATLVVAMVGFAYAGPSKTNINNPWNYGPVGMVDDLFDRHDADGDGFISRAEATAYFEEMAAKGR